MSSYELDLLSSFILSCPSLADNLNLFYDRDLGLRQAVEVINEVVNLAVSGGDPRREEETFRSSGEPTKVPGIFTDADL